VSGFVHQRQGESRGGVALTHGAGGNCQARLLVVLAEEFCLRGWTVLRYDLPFRRARRNGPPSRYSAAADQAGIRDAIAQVRTLTDGPVIAAGHSYGGRQTTMLAAAEPGLCNTVIAFSYPLHPPDKPDQLRTSHFPQLRTPVLFVHGSADPFGTRAEMETAIAEIPAPKRLVVVEGAGHDLKTGKFAIEPLVIANLDPLLQT
jgi:predicted alpha/beta-hydrolase family hydrolase